jgi:hypothetical protein
VLVVASAQQAQDACTAHVECRGVTYSAPGANGSIASPTKAWLKRALGRCHPGCGGAPWSSWFKSAPVKPPAATFNVTGGALPDLTVALRSGSFTVQSLFVGGANYSFVPPLDAHTALPLSQHLGDCTIRVRPATTTAATTTTTTTAGWSYYASAWGPFSAAAIPLPPSPIGGGGSGGRSGPQSRTVARHDITPLLEATNSSANPAPPEQWGGRPPLRVIRSYRAAVPAVPASPAGAEGDATATGPAPAARTGGALELVFEVTNVSPGPVTLGAFGMATPAAAGGSGSLTTNIAVDANVGGQHGWVEWVRVVEDEQCLLATPLGPHSPLESWRPILEYGGGHWSWEVHTAAWADDWEQNRQWPFLWMAQQLNDTGIWPRPRSPWPSWGDAGQTVRTNFSRARTPWQPPTAATLAPGETATYGMRLGACPPGGPRRRDEALRALGEPVLEAIPGYTLALDMEVATLLVEAGAGRTVVNATSSDGAVLAVTSLALHGGGSGGGGRTGGGREASGCGGAAGAAGGAVCAVSVRGLRRGRSRVSIALSDGSTATASYIILPPLNAQVQRVTSHWTGDSWLPRDSSDPFGRGAAVLPYDREDRRVRLSDARAYDVGLSDDAGAGNNLGLATTQAFAPTQAAVGRLDEYIDSTLYGVKTDTALPPFKSLQLPEPDNGVRLTMYYYCDEPPCAAAPHFPYNYTEQQQCASEGGLNYNWCMPEAIANATYRGFNYPHQIATYYAMYRAARNHRRLQTRHSWDWCGSSALCDRMRPSAPAAHCSAALRLAVPLR